MKDHEVKLLQEYCNINPKTKLQYYRVAPLAGLNEKAGKDTPFYSNSWNDREIPPCLTISIYFLSSVTLKCVSSN